MRLQHERIFKSGDFYHICNKSIAGYQMFKSHKNALRFIAILDYYNDIAPVRSFSNSLQTKSHKFLPVEQTITPRSSSLIKIISYCIMPDHYHLLVKIKKNDVLSHYINTIEASFTRFFNLKFKRKGPMWQSRFRAVRITSHEQLLHVSRYIHLNPTIANLAKKPEGWKYSSYQYLIKDHKVLSDNIPELSVDSPIEYKKFCNDRIDYQKTLAKNKRLLLDYA